MIKVWYVFIVAFVICLSPIYSQNYEDFRKFLEEKNLSLDELKSKLNNEQSQIKKAVIANEIGIQYQYKGNLDSAKFYHLSALSFAKKESETNEEIGVSLNKTGIVNYYEGHIDSAIYYFENAQKYLKSPYLKANTYSNLGLMNKINVNPDKAIEAYLDALTIFKELDKPKKQIAVLNNLSALHFQLNNYEKSKSYASEGIIISTNNNLEFQKFETLINLGNVLKDQDSLDKAITIYKSCEDYFIKIKDTSNIIRIKNNLSISYGYQNEYAKSIQLYKDVIELYKNQANQSQLAAIYLNLGTTYQTIDSVEQAKKHVLMSLKIAREMQNTQYYKPIYNTIAEIYKANNQLDSSLYYKERLIEITDSLNLTKKEIAVHQIENEYQNEELSEQVKENENKLSVASTLINVFIGVLVISAIILLYLLFNSFKQKRQKDTLDKKIKNTSSENTELKQSIKEKQNEIEKLKNTPEAKEPYPSNLTPLTNREKDVLLCLSEGLKDQEIADKLFVSPATVRTHLRNAYVKINVSSRTEAMTFVLKHEL